MLRLMTTLKLLRNVVQLRDPLAKKGWKGDISPPRSDAGLVPLRPRESVCQAKFD